MLPPPHVFDLFAVPEDPEPCEGGQGRSVRAGDLVLSPGRDGTTAAWLNPVLARLAVELDHERPRSLRIAMPIPARDLRWVVDGWGATRFEPDARPCEDLCVLLAAARLLHARLASVVGAEPPVLAAREDRWAAAERATFGADPPLDLLGPRLAAGWDEADLGPDQLVHGDLAGNVLLDREGLPVVIDLAPYWRPTLWAEAVLVLDAVLWHGADPAALADWATGAPRQAMLRAALFRMLSDESPDLERYRSALEP